MVLVSKNKVRNGERRHRNNGRRGPLIWPGNGNGGHADNLAPFALAFVLDPLRHVPGLEDDHVPGLLPDWSQAGRISVVNGHPIHHLLPDIACGVTFAGFTLSGEVVHGNDGNGHDQRLQEAEQRAVAAERQAAQLEQQLAEAQRQVAQARLLASTAAHDINNLLTAVLGYLSLLVAAGLHPGQEELLRPALKAVETMTGIVKDVLDLAKLQNGKTPCKLQPVELDGLVTTVIGFCAQAAQEKNVQVTFERSPEVPAVIMGNPKQLERGLLNLLNNAIKFTPQGGGAVVIRMVTTSDGNMPIPHLRVSVSDTGIGMSEATLSRLFQPFARADESVPGTGLGLTIARQLVEVMGGKLEVESHEGKGTTFWFALPLLTSMPLSASSDRVSAADLLTAMVQDELSTAATSSSVPVAYNGNGHAGTTLAARAVPVLPQFSGQVLVVGSEHFLCTTLLQHLSALGLTATVVPTGMEALAATRVVRHQGGSFALILMSSILAEGSCLFTAERIRAEEADQGRQDAHVPIIALADHPTEVTADQDQFDGVFDGLLSKSSLTLIELAEGIRNVLDPRATPDPVQ